MNYLGIDYGRQRVGLAIGDDQTKQAEPFKTVAADRFFDEIRALLGEHKIGKIIVGLPRGLDGQETKQTGETRRFIAELAREVDLPVDTIDEAVTSELAREKLGPKAPKESIDMEAATIFLKDYLNQ